MPTAIGVSMGEKLKKRSKYGKVNREFFDKNKVTRTSKRAKVKGMAGTGIAMKRTTGIKGEEREMVFDRVNFEKRKNYTHKPIG